MSGRGYPSSDRQVSDLTPPMTTNESAPDPTAGERCACSERPTTYLDDDNVWRCWECTRPATPDTDPTAGERGCPEDDLPCSECPDYCLAAYPATPDADDASTYCGAEFGEVRAGECECPKCASDHPDPLQDWPLPGHLKSDASEPR